MRRTDLIPTIAATLAIISGAYATDMFSKVTTPGATFKPVADLAPPKMETPAPPPAPKAEEPPPPAAPAPAGPKVEALPPPATVQPPPRIKDVAVVPTRPTVDIELKGKDIVVDQKAPPAPAVEEPTVTVCREGLDASGHPIYTHAACHRRRVARRAPGFNPLFGALAGAAAASAFIGPRVPYGAYGVYGPPPSYNYMPPPGVSGYGYGGYPPVYGGNRAPYYRPQQRPYTPMYNRQATGGDFYNPRATANGGDFYNPRATANGGDFYNPRVTANGQGPTTYRDPPTGISNVPQHPLHNPNAGQYYRGHGGGGWHGGGWHGGGHHRH